MPRRQRSRHRREIHLCPVLEVGTHILLVFAEDDAYNRYACTENGIFLLGDNGKIEQVMDGKNMSTNAYTNSARLDFMCAKDGVFYVNYLIAGDNQRKYRLCSYSK